MSVSFFFFEKQSRQAGGRFYGFARWSHLCRWRLHFKFF